MKPYGPPAARLYRSLRLPSVLLLILLARTELAHGDAAAGRPDAGAQVQPSAALNEALERRERLVGITCDVRDSRGEPVVGIAVSAFDEVSDVVTGIAVSDENGRATLMLPARPHKFAVLSDSYGIQALDATSARSFRLTLIPHPPEPEDDTRKRAPAVVVRLSQAGVLRVKIVDESGKPLAGVLVEAIRPSGSTARTARSNRDGTIEMALLGGAVRVRPYAPGLKLVKVKRQPDAIELTMGIDAAGDEVRIVEKGHVLRFRMDDSVDPEYIPPPQVAAWLKFAYCIDYNRKLQAMASSCMSGWRPIPDTGYGVPLVPSSVARRCHPEAKYWWLHLIRTVPPNPAGC